MVDNYEKSLKIFHSYQQLKESTDDWLNNKLLVIETTEDVSDKTKSIEKQKENLVELRNMITDVAKIIELDPNNVPLNEIEKLSLKLEKIQNIIIELGNVASKKNKISNDIDDAKQLLHNIEKASTPFKF